MHSAVRHLRLSTTYDSLAERQYTRYVRLLNPFTVLSFLPRLLLPPPPPTWSHHILTFSLEPGKRSLVLGVNGFGNLAGVIGSQLYRQKYAPKYLVPFYGTLAFVAAALVGYMAYRFTLQAVNKKKLAILAGKSPGEIEQERVDEARYADRKWTFMYGL